MFWVKNFAIYKIKISSTLTMALSSCLSQFMGRFWEDFFNIGYIAFFHYQVKIRTWHWFHIAMFWLSYLLLFNSKKEFHFFHTQMPLLFWEKVFRGHCFNRNHEGLFLSVLLDSRQTLALYRYWFLAQKSLNRFQKENLLDKWPEWQHVNTRT